MLLAHSPAILLGLQLLNAIYIGILGGIGMLYFQDLMPGQAGSATTPIQIPFAWAGLLPDRWRALPPLKSDHAVFWFALMMIVATVACLTRIKDV